MVINLSDYKYERMFGTFLSNGKVRSGRSPVLWYQNIRTVLCIQTFIFWNVQIDFWCSYNYWFCLIGWWRWMPKSRSITSIVRGAPRPRSTESSAAGRRTSRNRFRKSGRSCCRLPQTFARHRTWSLFAQARVLRWLQCLPLSLQPRRPITLGGQRAQDPAWPQRRELLPSARAYSSRATFARFSFPPQLSLDNAFNQSGIFDGHCFYLNST